MSGSDSVSRAAGETTFGRITLGNVAIFACLAGGAAAISSAGVAFPIKNVGFSGDWMSKALFAEVPGNAEPVRGANLAVKRAVVVVPAVPAGVIAGLSLPDAQPIAAQAVLAPSPARLVQARPSALSLVTEMQTGVRDPFGNRRAAAIDSEILNPAAGAPAALAGSASPTPAYGERTPVQSDDSASLAASHAIPQGIEQSASPEARLDLIAGPEIAGFDLARVRGSTPTTSAALAKPATKPLAAAKAGASLPRDHAVGDAIFHQVGLSVGGSPAQAISVRIGSDMKPSIKVADLLGLVADQLDPDSAARFTAAASAQDYVSLATLREAGFQVAYNAAADSISISAAP